MRWMAVWAASSGCVPFETADDAPDSGLPTGTTGETGETGETGLTDECRRSDCGGTSSTVSAPVTIALAPDATLAADVVGDLWVRGSKPGTDVALLNRSWDGVTLTADGSTTAVGAIDLTIGTTYTLTGFLDLDGDAAPGDPQPEPGEPIVVAPAGVVHDLLQLDLLLAID
ncbi:MAG: hypothetical protein ABMB14_08820 [Myxococcota bacterium]